jgi:hypothetical protein
MATSNQYDVKVAEQAHSNAVTVLAERQQELKTVQKQLLISAATIALTKAEIQVLVKKGASINDVPIDRKTAVAAQYKKLSENSVALKEIQKTIDRSQTAVKATQLDLNAAINGTRITQGKAGLDVSPAIDPNAKQVPYTVRSLGTTYGPIHSTLTGTRQVTPPGANNSDLLNNPTGLILGATALSAITRNPNLISSVGSGIGRFFNNAGDILPVSTNVPGTPAPVTPALVPAPAAVPPTGEATAAAAPVVGDEALAAAQDAQEVADLRIAAESATPVPPEDDGLPPPPEFNDQPLEFEAAPLDPDTEALLEQQQAINRAQLQQQEAIAYAPAPVPLSALNESEFGATNVVQNQADIDANNSVARGATNRAQQQSTLQTRVNQPAAADWRVRLRLAPNADYLYKVPAGTNGKDGPGILAPLAATDGVVFPYTPSIETSYQAKYDSYDLTHSNYRGYFYKSSMIENISIKGTFTAQDTYEAAYLLAVIHFFKSVTKMFYGQDAQAGTPPPLVYLSGFGKYQFNENPCVVTNFGYSLPNDVDYIRADGFNNIGLNLENRRPRTSGPAIGGSLGTVVAIIDRLTNAGFKNGSLTDRPSPGQVTQNVTNQTSINSTYVPTKMEISITLLPMQTRNQVSKQFSLKSFANGSLLAGGGFW